MTELTTSSGGDGDGDFVQAKSRQRSSGRRNNRNNRNDDETSNNITTTTTNFSPTRNGSSSNCNSGAGRGRGGRGRQHNNSNNHWNNKSNPFQKKGWSKPPPPPEPAATAAASSSWNLSMLPPKSASSPPLPYTEDDDDDPIAEEIAALVQSAVNMEDGDDDDDDDADATITAALASTAAVAFFATVAGSRSDALLVETQQDKDTTTVEQPQRRRQQEQRQHHLGDGDQATEKDAGKEPYSDFASLMKRQDMANLMADFGQQDINWKKKDVAITTTEENATDGLETSSFGAVVPSSFPSRLAPHGKAPIHIVLESFGYIHGAPQSQLQSWSPYSQPLPALDMRRITDPVPTHLLFHDGLRSGIIKRILQGQHVMVLAVVVDTECSLLSSPKNQSTTTYAHLQDYARRYVARESIFPKIVEAQTEGQHGYVNPVTMTISIGSHLGRHRSVVIVEWVAIELRKLLRQNSCGVLAVPVSVETVHRDVDKKVPANATTGKRRNDDHVDGDDDKDRV